MHYLWSIFIAAHGLVHLWYVVLSNRWIPYEPEMGWTGISWVLGGAEARVLASFLFGASCVLFVAAAGALALDGSTYRPLLKIAAPLSLFALLLFWDGNPTLLVQKGLIGMAIDVLLLGLLAFNL